VLWRRLAIALAAVTSLLALLAYGFYREPRYIYSQLIGKPAPSFQLALFDGSQLRLAELRGKVVFVNFWSSWCPPCRAEARELEEVWKRFKDQGVVFVGIAIQDRREDALAFVHEFNLSYPTGLDASGKIPIDFGVWGIPETFFINREGVITYKHVGTVGTALIAAKLDEARRNIVSAGEGKGSYQSIH
jgi:cytochrome c biogenesis protein CcmG, thiol:disulfide interchange protein DsbE